MRGCSHRLNEVLTSTHNLCFGAKVRKIGKPLHTPVLLYKSVVYITRKCHPDATSRPGFSLLCDEALKIRLNVHACKSGKILIVGVYGPFKMNFLSKMTDFRSGKCFDANIYIPLLKIWSPKVVRIVKFVQILHILYKLA